MNQPPQSGPNGPAVKQSLKEAKRTCEALAAALGSMDIAAVITTDKTPEEYKLAIEYRDEIAAMRTIGNNSQASVRNMRMNASEGVIDKKLQSIDEGYDKFLADIEVLYENVVLWIEDYEKVHGRISDDSAQKA
ncbi:hypothetical protein CH63R_02084 [Colletotrichum higginsianum IMI 349063]|uniref:Uncharacterized protein n=2 Tax=Colletotrichum higginsianum TaxID=80884 RepID=A0A1B7YN81_COLHI|nr:hypothetical protein CH63R_02084 [Colletotrichum higginsianum IMI 349063]OBR13358.1 hypothetical protein CH63R_02084 [Colletotrichum higginsianum IMI 349063]TID02407.1 hypothetical protein CH35J_003594 [Colletotrichum higginsianum]